MHRSLPILPLILVLLFLSNRALAQGSEPGKDEFIEVTEEPRPIIDIQEFVIYPEAARRADVEGRVVVSALIDETGKVIKVDVETSDHPWLEEAAVEAMKKARFTPAKQGAKPIKVWYTQSIIFKLNGPRYSDTPVEESGELAQEKIWRIDSSVRYTSSRPQAPAMTKAPKPVGELPVLPQSVMFEGRETIELELKIGTMGDVLEIKPTDNAFTKRLPESLLKVVRAIKFSPGEIDFQTRVTTNRFTFKLK